jgi:anti-anti-sigma regulatory factor
MASVEGLEITEAGGVLYLAGSLDDSTVRRLDEWTSSHRLSDPLAFEEATDYIVDLSELKSMDVVGLLAIDRLRARVRWRRLLLRNPTDDVRSVLIRSLGIGPVGFRVEPP